MAKQNPNRLVKCNATGEMLPVKDCVRIDGKYYKSEEAYNMMMEIKSKWQKITQTIIYEIFEYEFGQKPATVIFKFIQELKFYEPDIILQVLKNNTEYLTEIIRNKDFYSDYNRCAYIFAIINSKANELYRKYKKEKREQEKINSTMQVNMLADNLNATPQKVVKQKNSNISRFVQGG